MAPTDPLVYADKPDSLEGVPISGDVYFTLDINQFTRMAANRPVDSRSVNNMASSIRRMNLLKHCPLVVTTAGGIVDGQTRWLAAKQLEDIEKEAVGLYYTVLDPSVDPYEAMIVLNATNKPWNLDSYLHHFQARGVQPWAHIYGQRELHRDKGFHVSAAATLKIYGLSSHVLKTGKPMPDMNLITPDRIFWELHNIWDVTRPRFEEIKHTKTIEAYKVCRKEDEFMYENLAHFVQKYTGRFLDIVPQLHSSNTNHRVETLAQMHNYKRDAKNRISPRLVVKETA
jgi:hypothetical protein